LNLESKDIKQQKLDELKATKSFYDDIVKFNLYTNLDLETL